MLGLQCKLRKYQGPDYDGTPLEEAADAGQAAKACSSAGELDAEQKQRLAEIDGQLKQELATREYRRWPSTSTSIEEYGTREVLLRPGA